MKSLSLHVGTKLALKIIRGKAKAEVKVKDSVKIKGLLLPTSWDHDGSPESLMLSAADEKEYIILRNHHFEGLLKHAGQFVELNGILSGENYSPEITVLDFIRLPHLLT